MEKTYTFTKEELLNNCRLAYVMTTFSLMSLRAVDKEERGGELDKCVDEILGIFTRDNS